MSTLPPVSFYFVALFIAHIQIWVRYVSISDSNVTVVCVWCFAGGGGEETQSLLGLQLSRASESNLLRQL